MRTCSTRGHSVDKANDRSVLCRRQTTRAFGMLWRRHPPRSGRLAMIALPTCSPRRLISSVLAILIVVGSAPRASAQVADAVIEIVALDESGAALPGVTVTV